MRTLLPLVLLTRLAAQTPPAPEAAPAPLAQPERAISFTGSLDTGYRWLTDVGGSLDTYRSVVNLGEGAKLLGADFTILDPRKRLFDRLEARGYNWGDDPYTTLHVSARKERIYELNAAYRNIAYFSAMPSFANPLLERGILLNQRSFDTRRRISSIDLDLRPGSRIVPYLAYGRNSEAGNGITTFVSDRNEYPLPERIAGSANNYRGGVRFELPRYHFTIEQGGTTFRDDQQVFTASGAPHPGNSAGLVLGQRLTLTGLRQAYGIRGTGVYSKGLFTASPASWVDLHGQFLYSQPESDVNYEQFNTGNFVELSQALFYTGQQYLLSAASSLPHTAAGFGFELRPWRKLRVMQSWLTDRLHTVSSSRASQTLTPAPALPQPAPGSARLVSNYSQEQVDVLFDVTAKLMLRGGYRYVWGEASTLVLPAAGLVTPDSGELRRHAGIGGFSFRPHAKIVVSGEVEAGSSGRTFFRTSLNDYSRAHAKARYQALGSLSFAADFSLLDNQNPSPAVQYDYRSRQTSLSVQWSPRGGRRWTLLGDYSRATVRSNILYLVPQSLRTAESVYRENAHVATAIADIALPGYRGLAPKLSLGGSLLASSGSRPTGYYQPMVKASLPFSERVAWVSEWRYYGFGESFFAYEAFRTHAITTGFRYTR